MAKEKHWFWVFCWRRFSFYFHGQNRLGNVSTPWANKVFSHSILFCSRFVVGWTFFEFVFPSQNSLRQSRVCSISIFSRAFVCIIPSNQRKKKIPFVMWTNKWNGVHDRFVILILNLSKCRSNGSLSQISIITTTFFRTHHYGHQTSIPIERMHCSSTAFFLLTSDRCFQYLRLSRLSLFFITMVIQRAFKKMSHCSVRERKKQNAPIPLHARRKKIVSVRILHLFMSRDSKKRVHCISTIKTDETRNKNKNYC